MRLSLPFAGFVLLAVSACASGPVLNPGGAETSPARRSPNTPTVPAAPEAPVRSAPYTKGLDCSRLIPMTARDTGEGIALEQEFIAHRYPGARQIAQRTGQCGSRKVDIITIETKDGYRETLNFDVTDWFGKTGGEDLDDLLDG